MIKKFIIDNTQGGVYAIGWSARMPGTGTPQPVGLASAPVPAHHTSSLQMLPGIAIPFSLAKFRPDLF